MEIILSILQILGIILLAILGFTILVILLVLFVPIRYKILGKIHESIYLEGNISWLLHLLRAKVSYEDELLYVEIGILWKMISFSKEFGASDEKLEEEEAQNNSKSNSSEDSTKQSNDEDYLDKSTSASTSKLENLFNKIKEKISFIKKKAVQIKKLIQDKKNQLAVKHLKDEFFYLMKILLPKKSQLKGIFSTGSPDTTGQTFGVICCFPIIYQDKWSLTPDFHAEKAYFEGDFHGKGRIYVFQIIGILIRIMIDKNCRRLYYILKRLGGKNNGGRK